MLTAHLPAGYVAARLGKVRSSGPFWAILAASVLPDIDLIWFYLIDDRAFHHHHYWVHIPGFWLIIAVVALPLFKVLRPTWLPTAFAFFAGISLHLILDTIAGSVAWAWPFSEHLYAFVTVPATHTNWIVSFITHWTFALEMAIWGAALILFWRARAHKSDHTSE